MIKIHVWHFVAGAIAALMIGVFVVWGIPYFFQPAQFSSTIGTYGSQISRARVTNIIDQGDEMIDGRKQVHQLMQVELLDGPNKGMFMQSDYLQLDVGIPRFAPGDEIYVQVGPGKDNSQVANYFDYVRSAPMLILLVVFTLAILVMGRWKGLGSLVGLGFSMLMIVGYVIPHILSGEDPIKVSLIGSILLLGATLYLTYGWNLKTHASMLSMTVALAVTGLLSVLFVNLARLTGFGDENTMYLIQFSSAQIDPHGLLLGGMIIGALGVLGDLVTAQSAAVVEIHDANPSLGFQRVFEKAMHIGEDHVAATVNTLVLAYTGAALPLLLIFTLGSGNYTLFLNSEFLAEEIVRTLVGSLGLIAAVPISTLIATVLIVYQDRLGEWRTLLGPQTGDRPFHSHG